jgi:hypothetical protein
LILATVSLLIVLVWPVTKIEARSSKLAIVASQAANATTANSNANRRGDDGLEAANQPKPSNRSSQTSESPQFNQSKQETKSSTKTSNNTELSNKINSNKINNSRVAETAFLPRILGGLKAVGAVQVISAEANQLADKAIHAEYGVQRIVQQQYGDFLVRIFVTEYPAEAYGLYTFYRVPISTATDFGTEGDFDVVEGFIRFWQGTRFVTIERQNEQTGGGVSTEKLLKLGQNIAQAITDFDAQKLDPSEIATAKQLPMVIRSLPPGSLSLRTARYFIGPQALARITQRDVSQYMFYPDFGTEMVLATYEHAKGQMTLMITEYHTPQQASEALKRVQQHREGLPAAEKAEVYVNRQGNFIVEVRNFKELIYAEAVAKEVKYEYGVKWLNDVLPPVPKTNFNTEARKTGELLVSVMGIIGIGMTSALVLGIGFGFTIFYLRRRNNQQGVGFSSAGGMMRLNLDGIDLSEHPPEVKLLDRNNS